MDLDKLMPDLGHLRRYRVWYTMETEAESPEVAAGETAAALGNSRAHLYNLQLQRVEELDA